MSNISKIFILDRIYIFSKNICKNIFLNHGFMLFACTEYQMQIIIIFKKLLWYTCHHIFLEKNKFKNIPKKYKNNISQKRFLRPYRPWNTPCGRF